MPDLKPDVVTLTDASTVTVNAAQGNHFRLLTTSGVGATRKLGNPSNPVNGQKITFEVIQDGSGSRALTYDTAYAGSTGLPLPTLTTTASARDFLGFIYNSTTSKWYLLSFMNGSRWPRLPSTGS